MYCTNCGSSVSDAFKFCPCCGQAVIVGVPVAGAEQTPPEVRWAVAEQTPPEVRWAAPQPAPVPAKKARGKKLWLIGGLAAALVLVLAGVGLFFLLGSKEKKWVMCEAVTYDRNNNITARRTLNAGSTFRERQYTGFDADGKETERIAEKYDDRGNLTEGTSFTVSDQVEHRYEYQYDPNDNPTEIKRYQGGTLTDRYVYAYDKTGNELSYIHYDETGTVSDHTEYAYDSNGNQISYISYDGDGKIKYHREFEYDADDRKTLETTYDENGKWKYRTEYTYDVQGELLTELTSSADGYSWGYSYKNQYDENGKLLSQKKYDEDGDFRGWSDFVHFADGSYEETAYGSDGTRSAVYGYSKDGDWTKYISYDTDGAISYLSIRENDAEGRPVLIREKSTSEETDSWTEYAYDQNGNLTVKTEKDPETQEVVARTEYQYRKMG